MLWGDYPFTRFRLRSTRVYQENEATIVYINCLVRVVSALRLILSVLCQGSIDAATDVQTAKLKPLLVQPVARHKIPPSHIRTRGIHL